MNIEEALELKKMLKKEYFKLIPEFNNTVVPLEELELRFHTEIGKSLECIYENDKHARFEIELYMFPSWATKGRRYLINGNFFTHIRFNQVGKWERKDEIEKLLAQNKIMVEALTELSKLGNGENLGNSVGNVVAQQALTRVHEVEK